MGESQPAAAPTLFTGRRAAHMRAVGRGIPPEGCVMHRSRALSFLGGMSLLALTVLVLLAGCTGGQTTASPQGLTVRQGQVHRVSAPALSTSVQTAQRRLYTFAASNVGLMQPAVDAQGNVWIGEMHINRLGSLNAQTGVVTSWEPPDGRYGIMTTTVDAQGDAWFAELYANYIGRFDKRQQTFRIFPLGAWQGSPLGPQDLHFDGTGLLWFTAVEAGALGRLDPRAG